MFLESKKNKIILIIDKEQRYYTDIAYSYLRAFEKNGYDCSCAVFNVDENLYKVLKYFPGLTVKYLKRQNDKIIDVVRNHNSNLIFVLKGFYLLPETIEQIKENNKTVICFNPDDPFSSIAGSSNDNIRRCISYYDAYFIWHKSLIQKLKDAGCKQVFYLPFAADAEIFIPPADNSIEEHYAVSFVGNADKERKSLILGKHLSKVFFIICRKWRCVIPSGRE